MKKCLTYIIGVTAALILCGCEHKELCYDHAHVVSLKVNFDWQLAPEANPSSMSLYLYPEDGGEAMRYEFTDRRGGTIRVPIGRYDALCLNSGTENLRYRHTERRETFEVYTRDTELLSSFTSLGVRSDGAPRAEGTEDERVALQPDIVWSGSADDILLTLGDEGEVREVTLLPDAVTVAYTIVIRNIDNLKYAMGLDASLSTLAESVRLYDGAPTGEDITLPFGLQVRPEEASATGSLLTFGHCPSRVDNRHYLTVYAILADGNRWYYTYDVTDQIHGAADPRDIIIEVDGLPLPKPLVNGGGFQPVINEWQQVDIEITM